MLKNISVKFLKKAFATLGLEIRRVNSSVDIPLELDREDLAMIEKIEKRELSMVPREGLYAVLLATKYLIAAGAKDSFVECGVFRGGVPILVAYLLKKHGLKNRIILIDTFAGMTKPSNFDYRISTAEKAIVRYNDSLLEKGASSWCYASLEEVKQNFSSFGLLSDSISFIQGDVSVTLHGVLPTRGLPLFGDKMKDLESISFLRLDTDWYESTKVELEYLYPRLGSGGVLIIDDYGNWSGAKRATDEFFLGMNLKPFLIRIQGDSGRIFVKP